MGQASSRRNTRGAQVAMAVALSVLGTSTVAAADVTKVDGNPQFPNVRFVDAPQLATTMSGPQGGMRAYKDSADSPLRGPSTEEMAAAAPKASTSNARRAAAEVATQAEVQGMGDAVGIPLDESTMQYTVVVRQPDGSLAEVCVPGAQLANDIVKRSPVIATRAKKEILNDR